MSKECHLRDLVIAFNSKLRADELFTNLYNLNAKNIAYILLFCMYADTYIWTFPTLL